MFEFDPGVILWAIINFVGLLIVLRLFAWKPILEALEKREDKIRSSLENADAAQKEAEDRLRQYVTLLENSKQEALELLAKGKEEGETARRNIVETAQEEAKKILDQAKREISLEMEKALDELKQETVNLSIEIAGKVLSRQLTDEDHKMFIQQATREIQNQS